MKILFLGDPTPDAQDQLADSLLHGFVRIFGQSNVDDYHHFLRNRGTPEYLRGWPLYLGALAYQEPIANLQKPTRSVSPDDFDVTIATMRFLQNEHKLNLRYDRLIVINSEDGPTVPPDFPRPPLLIIHRPGNAWSVNGSRQMSVHISVPSEWIRYQMGNALPEPEISVYAAMSDNHQIRRDVAAALCKAAIPKSVIRFGSGSGYEIEGAQENVQVPRFLREVQAARCVVNVRGGGMDTMMVSEALQLRKLLVTDDFGCDAFVDGIHCLKYRTADECVEKVLWALSNPREADIIAGNGAKLHAMEYTPEAQAIGILRQAGFVKERN